MNRPLRTRRLLVTLAVAALAALAVVIAYTSWSPGMDVTDGSDDRGANAIWLQHGWLGDDAWFAATGGKHRPDFFRDLAAVTRLAKQLRAQHITDVFPHLCPAAANGELPAVDHAQVERFLDAMGGQGVRVLPWIGGPVGPADGTNAIADLTWRRAFVASVRELLARHPRLAGVHLNIEPCPSGNADFLALLDELGPALGRGASSGTESRIATEPDTQPLSSPGRRKILSIAAYPPPTIWHRHPEVHWDEAYYRAVAPKVDQLAVMLYDTSITRQKVYRHVVAQWTVEVVDWTHASGARALLGLPAYDDAASYHDPTVESLHNALLGVHAGLRHASDPEHYQGAAIYSEWQMNDDRWREWREHFRRR